MAEPGAALSDVTPFIARWSASGGAERANSQLFLSELCAVLGVPPPDPAVEDPEQNAYTFERAVTFRHGDGTTSNGFVDLYRRGCFVLESKQGVLKREGAAGAASRPRRETPGMDQVMARARNQAEGYIRALPAGEGRPPFLITCDVGHSFELFAEFSRSGGTYTPFPEPGTHRVRLPQLESEEVRDRLRAIWLDPLSLDPARRSAKVTREISRHLAGLAKVLEADHDAEAVAEFLMRCLFCMFAEDAGLLPGSAFGDLVAQGRERPEHFTRRLEELWRAMKTGEYSYVLDADIPHFNGPLFENPRALPLDAEGLDRLLAAARADWREVDPSIFGTLLERALDPRERHKLGAHYTPRAYVERLVLPTVVEPLREEWTAAQAAAALLAGRGDDSGAVAELRGFHTRLCQVRILDPACGTGNFLYVSLEHLKRLEGEVLDELAALGYTQTGLDEAEGTVEPRQFLGLEINPRAAHIAELVLWIGYLQWHLRTHGGRRPPEPILEKARHIEHRDAVLDYDSTRPRLDAKGQPVTRWDGHSRVTSPVTGEQVPDETARVLVLDYLNPRPASWPAADFVVGNPPFIGKSRRRAALGDGYLDALCAAYPQVPDGCDYVLYWWAKGAELVHAGAIRSFGFITTNSVTQALNRRVLAAALKADRGGQLQYAIPDHPWVDSETGAAVRIAMTVFGAAREQQPVLATVVREFSTNDDEVGVELSALSVPAILADLSAGAAVVDALPLEANAKVAAVGVVLFGKGFIVDEPGLRGIERQVVRPLLIGRDVVRRADPRHVIDLYPIETADEVRVLYPAAYQWLLERVKPERDQIRDPGSRRRWWRFGRDKEELRDSISQLARYIVTPEVSKHSLFVFAGRGALPDHTLVAFATADANCLGVLSSRFHVTWALAAGGTLEDRPRYNKTRCFDPFPFPAATPEQAALIRDLGERLDAHRQRQQALHPGLTLTGMYNVLEKLRAGEALTAAERVIHEQGLVSVLREIHDALDAAVAAAYGWPADLPDEEILARLVALNAERAAEEAAGRVRWLRPEFQNPGGQGTASQGTLDGLDLPAPAAPAAKAAWPKSVRERIQAVRAALAGLGRPADAATVAACFARQQTARHRAEVAELLGTLADLGQVRIVEGGRYAV